jgi:hypothetical protein
MYENTGKTGYFGTDSEISKYRNHNQFHSKRLLVMYYERYGPLVIKTGLARVEIPVKPVISVPIPKYPNTEITTNFIPNAF